MVRNIAARLAPPAPAGRALTRPPVIDTDFLGRQALGDAGLMEEILRVFAARLERYFERVETSTSVAALIESLHALNAAAKGVGAFPLADLAGAAEDELRAGQAVDPARIERLALAVTETGAVTARLIATLET